MKHLVAAILAATLLGVPPARAADVRLLAEADVTLERLKDVYTAAYLKAEIDDDGDLRIDDDGMKTFVRIDTKRRLLTYLAVWRLKASVPRERKLQWANTLNQDLMLVRFAIPQSQSLVCDYQFFYEGGLSPYALIHHYRQFVKVVRGAVTLKDPEKIVGTDANAPPPAAAGI